MFKSIWGVALLPLALGLVLEGCSPSVRTSKLALGEAVTSVRDNVVSSGKLSMETIQVLRMAGKTPDEGILEAEKISSLPELEKYSSALDQRYVVAELLLAKAATRQGEPDAIKLFLGAAHQAFEGMISDDCKAPVSFLCDNLKLFHMRATLGVLRELQKSDWDSQKLQVQGYALSVNPATRFEDPKNYDSIDASGLVSFTGLANRHSRFGVGLPLIACRQKRTEIPEDKYLPKVGTCLPLTAVLNFPQACAEGTCPAQMELHNAFTTETVDIRGKSWPMMANFSTPFASLLEKTGLTDLSGMFSAFKGNEALLQMTGFYTTEPYDAGKIPLVTVHGLFSSPLTWVSLQNDLMGDPLIRKHFQIWNYLYPTNLPIIQNAKTFREKLDELDEHLRKSFPARDGLRDMVVISHSMGGILTKTAVGENSAPAEKFFFENPDKLKEHDVEGMESLRSYLNFNCKPYIARVIFVAVPFGGSIIADNWIGWIGRMLISLPQKTLQASVNLAQKVKGLVKPEVMSELANSDFTSVKGLSPKNPVLQALAQVAVSQHVPFHLIEGDRGLGGGDEASDGVVAFKSSHLEGAQSELIVPADHAAHVHPLAVQEIKRILYLHLESLKEKQGVVPAAKKKL